MKKNVRRIIFVVVLLAAVFAAFLVIRDNQRKENTYQQAVLAAHEGDSVKAYRLFTGLRNFKDAKAQASALEAQDFCLPYKAAEKGDIVLFGHWEQDGSEDNGPEPVEWIVLDKVDGNLLLLSFACLAGKAYNTEPFAPVTWETCSLRKWLNEDFLEEAFTEEEQALIPVVTNENPDHSLVQTPGGRDTQDRVFLLSERDTVIYLKDDMDRQAIGIATAADAAINDGLEVNEDDCSSWWLRSPGMYEYIAQFVDQNGVPYSNGASTDIDYLCGVRPVIWLDLKGAQP